MKSLLVATVLALAACGSAEIIAPSPLFVVDTYPGNGSSVRAGETTIGITWSEPLEQEGLGDAILVEEVSGGGAPLREVPARLQSYSDTTGTAVYEVEPLPAGTEFQMTLRSRSIIGLSGARLHSDLVRRFRTL